MFTDSHTNLPSSYIPKIVVIEGTGDTGDRNWKILMENGTKCYIPEYTSIFAEIREELEDIRAYDSAKSKEDDIIPFEQALNEIRSGLIK